MDLGVKAWHLPPRLITGTYFLSSGLAKRRADDATARQLHGFAAGTYPLLGKLDAKQFTDLLSTAEIAIGTALVVPVVPAWLAGAGLTAFALGTLGLDLRTPGMRQEGSLRPTQQGIPLAKDAWMVGIGLALVIDELAGRQAGPDRLPGSLRASSEAASQAPNEVWEWAMGHTPGLVAAGGRALWAPGP